MIPYEPTEHGRLIADTYLLTDTPQSGVINLCRTKGEKMRYDNQDNLIFIDFPGEYDIQDKNVVCYETGDLLHYQLVVDDQAVIIVQSPALLEKETLGDVATWICRDTKCKDAIERDELEGEIAVLTDPASANAN